MALLLAIVRTNDESGDVEEIHLDLDLRAELATELVDVEERVLRKGRFGETAAAAIAAAMDRVERRLKLATTSLT